MTDESAHAPLHQPCEYCGFIHILPGVCPRVKAFEYHSNGTLKRVEFHEPPQWSPNPEWARLTTTEGPK